MRSADELLIMMLSFQSVPTSSKGPLDLSRFLRGFTKTVSPLAIKDTNQGHKVDQIPRKYRSQRQGHLEVILLLSTLILFAILSGYLQVFFHDES